MQNAEHAVRPTEVVGIVSHELRTPLATILGCGELLEDDPDSSANVAVYAKRIRMAGETLRDVVADLIEFSKLSLAERVVEVRAVALRALWRDAAARCAVLATPAVAIDWQGLMPDRIVEVDPTIVTRALWHVVGNAVKFTAHGNVRVRGSLRDGVLTVTVQDPGIGIDLRHVPCIFEPFWQVDSSLVRQHGGTGLGLHLARRSLQQIGGTIEVTSRLGVGSTFVLAVPCAPRRRAEACDPPFETAVCAGPGDVDVPSV
jgi:signal transduction histidine kinase